MEVIMASRLVKGTLMEIWKSPYMFVHIKTVPWKFGILNLKNSRVIPLWRL